MSIDKGPGEDIPGKNAWKIGLGAALLIGQVLVFVPGKVAGQGQGQREPDSVRDSVSVANSAMDTGVDNTG